MWTDDERQGGRVSLAECYEERQRQENSERTV